MTRGYTSLASRPRTSPSSLRLNHSSNVARQQAESRRRDVGSHCHDDIDPSLKPSGKRGEKVAQICVDSVCERAGSSPFVRVASKDTSPGPLQRQDFRDRPGTGAQLDGNTFSRQTLDSTTGEGLALPTGNIDPRVDKDLPAAEQNLARDPSQRLATEAPFDQRGEPLLPTARRWLREPLASTRRPLEHIGEQEPVVTPARTELDM